MNLIEYKITIHCPACKKIIAEKVGFNDRDNAVRFIHGGAVCTECGTNNTKNFDFLYSRIRNKQYEIIARFDSSGWMSYDEKEHIKEIKAIIKTEIAIMEGKDIPIHDSPYVSIQPHHKRFKLLSHEPWIECKGCKNPIHIQKGDICPICGCDDYQKINEKDIIRL